MRGRQTSSRLRRWPALRRQLALVASHTRARRVMRAGPVLECRPRAHLSFHFLLSSRPAHFSNWEQLRMQPPWLSSTGGASAYSPEVHWMYRSLRAAVCCRAVPRLALPSRRSCCCGALALPTTEQLPLRWVVCTTGSCGSPVVPAQEVAHKAVAVHLAQRLPAQRKGGVQLPRALCTPGPT